MAINQPVLAAVDEVRAAFSTATVTVDEDGQGGAWVVVEDAPLPAIYVQPSTWIGFRITFQYPHADIYPHFVRSDLSRRDGRTLGDAISGGHAFCGRPALQISRRSNRWDPAVDTAALKLNKVLEWLTNRP